MAKNETAFQNAFYPVLGRLEALKHTMFSLLLTSPANEWFPMSELAQKLRASAQSLREIADRLEALATEVEE